MRERQHHPWRSPAFTLIELMIVVGIMTLLITIALPAFSSVRKSAKRTHTAATIQTMDIAIETFRTNVQLGHTYPPSVRVQLHVPAIPDPDGSGGKEIFEGANLIVWALAGADLLGTPGFRNLDNNSTEDYFGGWLSDTGNRTGQLYAIDSTGKPAQQRYGPYIDLSRMKLSTRESPGRYRIPHSSSLYSWCFLDAFDQPILYYKANVGARWPVDVGNDSFIDWFCGDPRFGYCMSPDYPQPSAGYLPNGVYNLSDNGWITGVKVDSEDHWGMDFGAGGDHPMRQVGRYRNPDYSPAFPTDDGTANGKPQTGTFAATVWNRNITAAPRPYRDDSYILYSAGADGLFGTGDDIANFTTNQ